ncbi:Anti-sigma F factor [Serratia plymuthica]|nr:Anti-sigma F factor [Serratia plymuthica]VEI20812.1 Anti-sigma F factor [Serratia plymuthica]
MASENIELQLSAALDSLEALSVALHQFVEPLSLEPAVVYQADLAASEALTNIIRHGVNHDNNQRVNVIFSYDGSRLKMTLIDCGKQIPADILNALSHAPRMFPNPEVQESWPENGIGLRLIYSMMDEVYYHSSEGSNELTLIKNTTASPAGQ